MSKLTKHFLIFIIGFALSPAVLGQTPENDKLCWAHYVSWGLNVDRYYDLVDAPNPLGDRTLLGKQVNTDIGVSCSTRPQILEAMRYGVDGFCVDITDPKAYTAMGRVYAAAEGLPFYVALCIDGWRDTPTMVRNLEAYLDRFGDHPNNCYVDGKPVIFCYKAATPEKTKEVIDALAAQGKHAYWLIQPTRENTLWDNTEKLEGYLDSWDGFYDFGSNGIPKSHMIKRLQNGRAAIEKIKPGGILVGGITQGYTGPFNAFYRPFFNTGTFRQNWEACLETDVDWVCLTTWNDYIESTHFEPAVWGRDLLLLYNQDMLRRWRGEKVIPRPADALISYQECTRLGDDLEIEVVSLPYTHGNSSFELRISDEKGTVLKEFPADSLKQADQTVLTYRLEAPGFDQNRILVPWARLVNADASEEEAKWKRLAPIQIVPNSQRRVRHYRLVLNDVFTDSPSLTAREKEGILTLTARFKAWSWYGKVTLLRNGRPLKVKEIEKFGPVETSVQFKIPADERQTAADFFNVRIDRFDRKLAWTNPYVWRDKSTLTEELIEIPVFKTGQTLDEFWMGAFGYPMKARLKPAWTTANVLPFNLQQITYEFNQGSGNSLVDTHHGVIAVLGGSKSGSGNAKHAPKWISAAGPNGVKRPLLHFEGAQWLSFPTRLMPTGAQTIQLCVRPLDVENEAFLFSDQMAGLDIKLDKDGYVYAGRKNKFAKSGKKIQFGEWIHVAASYDGQQVCLYLDRELVATEQVGTSLIRWNSMTRVGCLLREFSSPSAFYRGDLASMQWDARVLAPEELQTIKKVNNEQ